MLAVSPLRSAGKDENQGEMASATNCNFAQDFPDFSDANNLLDSIDFDDLFMGINNGDVLPDLEMDPELLAEFSVSSGGESEINATAASAAVSVEKVEEELKKEEEDKVSGSGISEEEIVSRREEKVSRRVEKSSSKDGDHNNNSSKGRKPSSSSSTQGKNNHSNNNNQAKRKVKVDWTPELHKRFVQAVEQLGVDKAVPSRILEIMGIDCLTRHNIASHLQKYRSHRKHLLAREAEAASWNQRRQMYGATAVFGGKREGMNPWFPPPTIGFPPVTPAMHHHPFRPLHVWGHPTMDQSLMNTWPIHIAHPPAPPSWAQPRPPPPPTAPATADPSFWHHAQQRIPNELTSPGTPCYPPPMATTRFPAPAVPGIPPHPGVYKVEPGIGVPTPQSGPNPLVDFYPSKESIDAAIGDVLSKPGLPLPLGLKPPSTDSVMVELHRQGVPKIPPSCA